jgi:hypothetical protein
MTTDSGDYSPGKSSSWFSSLRRAKKSSAAKSQVPSNAKSLNNLHTIESSGFKWRPPVVTSGGDRKESWWTLKKTKKASKWSQSVPRLPDVIESTPSDDPSAYVTLPRKRADASGADASVVGRRRSRSSSSLAPNRRSTVWYHSLDGQLPDKSTSTSALATALSRFVIWCLQSWCHSSWIV